MNLEKPNQGNTGVSEKNMNRIPTKKKN